MQFRYVKRGDKIEIPTAEWHNALVDVVRKELAAKRGITDRSAIATNEYKSFRKPMLLRANEDIPQYSIFTLGYTDTGGESSGSYIGTGSGFTQPKGMGFDPRFPRAYTKQVDETTPVDAPLFANMGQGMGTDGDYFLPIVGDETPVIVTIDTDFGLPEIGQSVGIDPGSYHVSVSNTGLTVVSAIEHVDNLVWVVRDKQSGLVELCLIDDHPGRGVVFDAYLGRWSTFAHKWIYDCSTTVKAIDWREVSAYPGAGGRGYFTPWPSDDYGTIYDCVSMDCSSPGVCNAGT